MLVTSQAQSIPSKEESGQVQLWGWWQVLQEPNFQHMMDHFNTQARALAGVARVGLEGFLTQKQEFEEQLFFSFVYAMLFIGYK